MLAVDKPKHIKINGIAFDNNDEKKLIAILKDKNLDLFLITLYQGLRKGEALAITGEDIDFINKTLTINKAINEHNEFDTTKNLSSNRVMPLFENSIEILKKYALSKERVFNIPGKRAQAIFTDIIKKNFPTKHYTIHSLRHTFVTKCQEAGIPLHIIQKWVGHTIGSKVTNTVYTHTREEAEQSSIEIFNKKND